LTDRAGSITQVDEIKRTSGPQTINGRRWEVQLSATPPIEWMALFRVSGESSAKAVPQRVEFDRTSAYFKSDEDQVEHWVASIDKWIASTNTRYLMSLDQVRRDHLDRVDAEAKEKDRIQRMNERFKTL
jgi:hypothetical protein